MDMHTLASLVEWDWPPNAGQAILAALRNGEGAEGGADTGRGACRRGSHHGRRVGR